MSEPTKHYRVHLELNMTVPEHAKFLKNIYSKLILIESGDIIESYMMFEVDPEG